MRAIPLTLLLAACTTPDLTQGDIEVIGRFSRLPMDQLLVTALLAMGDETTCPSVVEDEGLGTSTLSGGCTDSQGVAWAGTATLTEGVNDSGTLVFDGFGPSDLSAPALDGTIFVGEDRSMDADLDASWRPSADAEIVVVSYLDYGVSDLDGYLSGLFGETGATDAFGTLELVGTMPLVMNGSFSHDEASTCEDEFDSASLVYDGAPQGDLSFTWSAAACDGCADWTYGDLSGTLCP